VLYILGPRWQLRGYALFDRIIQPWGGEIFLKLKEGVDMGLGSFDPLRRITDLQERMVEAGTDVLLLNYSRSLFYYAGTTHPSFLVITPDDYYLIVTSGFDFAIEETWLHPNQVSPGKGDEDVKERLKKWGIERGRLGMELDILPTNLYLRVSNLLPKFTIVDISKMILDQRKIKDEREVEYTKEACRIVHQGHARVLEILHDGMTELELSAELENAYRRAGHEGFYFIRQFDFFMGQGVLASGENLSKIAGKVQSISGVGLSYSLPLGASPKKIRRGEMIVVDIPTYYQGYHCDQSRTYVLGKAPEVCKSLYQGVKGIADRMIKVLKPGTRCDHVYETAVGFAREFQVEPFFMRLGHRHKRVPFVGHGVGLELNEPPMLSQTSKETIEEGTIFALEMEMTNGPGEVIKLEDTLLMTSEGAELLTFTPRDLQEV
jgi:Xaa-Pro aminopeptidase